MGKTLQNIYHAILVIGFLLIILATIDASRRISYKELEVMTPMRVLEAHDGVVRYEFNVSSISVEEKDLAFFTHHQFYRVFADGEVTETMSEDAGIWGKSSGSRWNFVVIPYHTRRLTVEVTQIYNPEEIEEVVFYVGGKLDIYQKLLDDSLMSMLMCIILLVLGFTMTVMGYFIQRQMFVGRSLLYLGLFTFVFGLWSFNETDGLLLLFNPGGRGSFMNYILLILMCIVFILFTKEYIGIESNIGWKIICSLSVIEFIVCNTLHFLKIVELKETLFVTHIIMGISLLYMLMAMIKKAVNRRFVIDDKKKLIGIILIVMAAVVDLVIYYIGFENADFIGRFLILIFTIYLGRDAIVGSARFIETGMKGKLYEELAVTDSFTGLKNRNAYQMDQENILGDRIIVIFDLNDLKTCNDTLGHNEGDRYILEASHFIRDTFDAYGACYRIGGDEFCVLIEKVDKCPVEKLIEKINRDCESFNKSGRAKFKIGIASGYAKYTMNVDKDFKEAYDRADAMMYENKRKLKGLT